MLLLKKGGNVTSKEVKDLTGVPPSTHRRWVAAAKASGDWDHLPLKPAHRKRRSDFGQGKKLTRRMIATIKRRLLYNPSLTVDKLCEMVPDLSEVSRQRVNWAILHRIGLPSHVAKKKPLLTDFQVKRRKAWANKHKNWSKQKLCKILFSDEAHVEQWEKVSSDLEETFKPLMGRIEETAKSVENLKRRAIKERAEEGWWRWGQLLCEEELCLGRPLSQVPEAHHEAPSQTHGLGFHQQWEAGPAPHPP